MVVIVWQLDLLLPMQSVPITTNIVSSNPANGEVYLIQHYVIKFVSDLIQHYVIKFVSDLIQHYGIKKWLLMFLSIFRIKLPFVSYNYPRIQLTATI